MESWIDRFARNLIAIEETDVLDVAIDSVTAGEVQTLEEFDELIARQLSGRSLKTARYRYPDHLLYLVPPPSSTSSEGAATDSQLNHLGIGTTAIAGTAVACSDRQPEEPDNDKKPKGSRRGFLVVSGATIAAATALVLGVGRNPRKADAAWCACATPAANCQFYYNVCGYSQVVIRPTYKYWLDAGCGGYCGTYIYCNDLCG